MRINVHYDQLLNHTSFYRALGPFLGLEQSGGHDVAYMTGQPTWADIQHADVAFIHRPFLPAHLAMIQKYKAFGVPVWIDYDDDFLGLPMTSPVYGKIGPNGETVKACLQTADAVTVSTDFLKKAYSPHVDPAKIKVIVNALQDGLVPFRKPLCNKKRLVWRGNSTHDEDINSVGAELVSALKENPDWDLILLGGHRPAKVCQALEDAGIHEKDRWHVHPWIGDVYDYLHFLKTLEGSIMIVPLEDIPFNHAKSNIAWMEATWAGMRTLAPSWEEWSHDGCANYGVSFLDDLSYMMTFTDEANKRGLDSSWTHITENLLLSKVNFLREEILENLRDHR